MEKNGYRNAPHKRHSEVFNKENRRNLENGNKAVFAVCNEFYPNLFVEKSYFVFRKSWVRTYRLARFVAGSEILTGVFVAALRMTLKSALAIDGLLVADAGGPRPSPTRLRVQNA